MSPENARVNMYVALLVYEYSSSAPGFEPLYEETVTIIEANSKENATERARNFARSRQSDYENEAGETIRYHIKHLVDVVEINDKLCDQAEIYTRHFRNYDAYRTFEPMLSGEIES
ncbi:DUF4288 domain-containing protein [Pseudonocardia sp. MH-G8]|uniref:DUF4288 domain-containing protein n=1 Tax=Pseudonocardia sp. MH-G8 TaxID=1854588 RepID=UPI0013043CA3|nr:DUF4288 domain-containing protein [Pseudonocardia sp. MH-G8]